MRNLEGKAEIEVEEGNNFPSLPAFTFLCLESAPGQARPEISVESLWYTGPHTGICTLSINDGFPMVEYTKSFPLVFPHLSTLGHAHGHKQYIQLFGTGSWVHC